MGSGPSTKDVTTLALGLADIRVASSLTWINSVTQALGTAASMGALANTKLTSEVEFFKHGSGFPALEDYTLAIKESAKLECQFEELTPANIAIARGLSPDDYSSMTAHSGEIALGGMTVPTMVRVEAHYTFPDATSKMYVIFPKAQVESAIEVDLKKEDAAQMPVIFTAKRADKGTPSANVWAGAPLGKIVFKAA